MNVDYPAAGQIAGLRQLWKEAFEDNDLFLDAFFASGFSPCRCRCITVGDTVAAALYWFDVTCDSSRFAYLYAVATAKAHRGQGLCAALLEDTRELLEELGYDGILLVPENESLSRMYEKFGYTPCTAVDTFTASAGEEAIALREVGAAEFARLRRQLLPAGAVIQEGELLDFLATQCHFWAGEDWLAVGQIYDGKLVCAEFLGNRDVDSGLLRALAVPQGTFRTPGGTEPFGWFLPLRGDCERPTYFGLALD